MSCLLSLLLFVSVIQAAQRCSDIALSQLKIALEPAFPKLRFKYPLFLTYAPDGSDRIYVVEQGGRIYSFPNRQDVGKEERELFLDLSHKTSASGERGLLGLAFHPNFKQNGFFYVYYSDLRTKVSRGINHLAILSRFRASPDRRLADLSSEKILLSIPQPYSNHNGGGLLFGPDGYLYLALGDGGSAGDPLGNAQNLETLLGKILRIDVDQISPGRAYAIPKDNPFAGRGGKIRGEIWAYGLRNPWRFSFDRATGNLWAGDVGQNEIEEIDLIRKGRNYGWNLFEGSKPYLGGEAQDPAKYEKPVVEYEQDVGGRSVTGGYVYRGKEIPYLYGIYLYGDYTSGRVRALCYENGQVIEDREILASGLPIASFGEDAEGELYITAFDGRIYRFVGK